MVVVVMHGRVGRRARCVVVSVQVVQGKVLPVVASAQSEMVMVVSDGACAGVMFVGQSPGSSPLAHHHATKLACADVGQGHSAAPSSRG